jgi:LacI family transcriptional regulator
MVVRFSTRLLTSDDAEVQQAVEFIRDQVHAGISVDDVLRAVPRSRRTLEMRFRSVLGRSPAEEIRRVRIERAKRLLVETDAGMAGVARASGFSSANQLCETFRREAGVSPTRHRRQFRAG